MFSDDAVDESTYYFNTVGSSFGNDDIWRKNTKALEFSSSQLQIVANEVLIYNQNYSTRVYASVFIR